MSLGNYSVATITGVTQTKLTNQITGSEQWIPTKVVWTNPERTENWLIQTTLVGIHCSYPVIRLVWLCFPVGDSPSQVTPTTSNASKLKLHALPLFLVLKHVIFLLSFYSCFICFNRPFPSKQTSHVAKPSNENEFDLNELIFISYRKWVLLASSFKCKSNSFFIWMVL